MLSFLNQKQLRYIHTFTLLLFLLIQFLQTRITTRIHNKARSLPADLPGKVEDGERRRKRNRCSELIGEATKVQ